MGEQGDDDGDRKGIGEYEISKGKGAGERGEFGKFGFVHRRFIDSLRKLKFAI